MRHGWITVLACLAIIAAHVPSPAWAQAVGGAPAAIDAPTGPPSDVPAIETGPLEDGVIERWNWQKFWDYAACGAAIALATGGAGVVAVVIACGRIFALYWTT
jgi:hypothetical protein